MKETCDITDRKSILPEPPIGEDFLADKPSFKRCRFCRLVVGEDNGF